MEMAFIVKFIYSIFNLLLNASQGQFVPKNTTTSATTDNTLPTAGIFRMNR